ncbi:toprim domain-containing protein [Synechococcus sp. HK05]|uniref:DNA primase n=1 Tax=Synechococcus sp. HK05 TaxID=2725975 RepID=UPI001C38026B|nr:CHC2 zinc finger domain-containing protein [Synechococcus sp. HK05]MBV2351719.1 toprim domain-containing protein [Synechococcus sp. HK05]
MSNGKAGGMAASHRVVAGAGRRAPSGHPTGRPAGLLTPAVLESVRERAQITDLFGPAELKKTGREFVTRCPWHDDRHPSLSVSPTRNRVHCFVCGKGTDAIGWLQDRQGLSFQEAVLELARRTGVSVAEGDPEAQARFEQEWRERRQLMAQRSEQRQQFHQALLQQLEQGGAGADYLRSRGISPEIATTWQLGFASGRLVIPLNDASGQTVGFCGRATGNQEPKYRNSTGDLLFQRNGLVFGLDQAAEAIRKQGTALLVEGPLDVIQLHQAGFTHAVACLGTSVSELQLQLLRRQGMKHLLIALDGDSAGQAATERLIEQLQSQLVAGGLSASVVQLPEGQDADGLIRSQGPTSVEGLIASARHWLEWRLDRLLAPLAAGSASPSLETLQAVEQAGQALIEQLPDGVLRHSAEQRLNTALQGQCDAPASTQAKAPGNAALIEPSASTARQRAEHRALRLFLYAAECRELLQCIAFKNPVCRTAMEWLSNLALVTVDGEITAMGLQLADQLPGAIGAAIAQAAATSPDVIAVLQRDPQTELQALLDALEPI